MPDRAAGVERWRALGRLLPRDVRERVFEPAFGDLTYHWLTSNDGRHVPFGVRALSTFLGCFPVVIPRLFVKGGRLTGFGVLGPSGIASRNPFLTHHAKTRFARRIL